MRIIDNGRRAVEVTAKDIILAIIAKVGAGGAVGHVVEYAGDVISELTIEERLTVCNMSIEAGARAGMFAPVDMLFAYLNGRPHAPKGEQWDRGVAFWKTLPSDTDAIFDRDVALEGTEIEPMVTWGISPEDAFPITGAVLDPSVESDEQRRAATQQAIDYIGLKPGEKLIDVKFDRVFIGSCTNGRIEDLRAAASAARSRRAVVPTLVVPGSGLIRAQAEEEGLVKIFLEAGFEWREPGCSMCRGLNGDTVERGKRCASTSNRNFAGRQGPCSRTHLLSPAMAAAAFKGRWTDVRQMMIRGI
jgi:3-isopropylmalate/(R)-2-methylmalate dehydratase large subunit